MQAETNLMGCKVAKRNEKFIKALYSPTSIKWRQRNKELVFAFKHKILCKACREKARKMMEVK